MLDSLPDGPLKIGGGESYSYGVAALASGNVAGFLALDAESQAFFIAVLETQQEIEAVRAWDAERKRKAQARTASRRR